ncbi:MAG TPA: hypothetical protein PKZ76_12920 [Xanthomonadaceae bacterium]|nr:hypothetical protein [Xanthomonadaceae bacterium]
MRAFLLSLAMAMAALSTQAAGVDCLALDDAGSAVILSEQDVLLSRPGHATLLRLDGPCPGLTESAELWLRPARTGDLFCGAGDAIAIEGRTCTVATMIAVDSRGHDCFRGDRMRAWSLVKLDRMRVDTRDGSFELGLSGTCPDLSLSDQVRFRSRRGLREICGGANDAVIPLGRTFAPGTLLSQAAMGRDGGPGFACTIRSVERIERR